MQLGRNADPESKKAIFDRMKGESKVSSSCKFNPRIDPRAGQDYENLCMLPPLHDQPGGPGAVAHAIELALELADDPIPQNQILTAIVMLRDSTIVNVARHVGNQFNAQRRQAEEAKREAPETPVCQENELSLTLCAGIRAASTQASFAETMTDVAGFETFPHNVNIFARKGSAQNETRRPVTRRVH